MLIIETLTIDEREVLSPETREELTELLYNESITKILDFQEHDIQYIEGNRYEDGYFIILGWDMENPKILKNLSITNVLDYFFPEEK